MRNLGKDEQKYKQEQKHKGNKNKLVSHIETDGSSLEERLKSFDNKLKAIDKRKRDKDKKGKFSNPTAFGIAFRVVVDLVCGVAVGVGIGWLIDYLFGIGPIFMIVFMFIGLIAGFINVARFASNINNSDFDSGNS